MRGAVAAFAGAYLRTVAVELPVLLIGLDRRHSVSDRIVNGLWLSAVTLPVVWFVLPALFPGSRTLYLVVAESFAALAEVALFFWGRTSAGISAWPSARRDSVAIVAANVASFVVGTLTG